MDNCVINMPVSIGLQKNSPLLQRSDKFLRRAIETGLAEKWLSDVTEPLKAAQVQILHYKNYLYSHILICVLVYFSPFFII